MNLFQSSIINTCLKYLERRGRYTSYIEMIASNVPEKSSKTTNYWQLHSSRISLWKENWNVGLLPADLCVISFVLAVNETPEK